MLTVVGTGIDVTAVLVTVIVTTANGINAEIIDPGGNAKITDVSLAESFVKRAGRSPDWNEVMQVLELREAARRFRSKATRSGRSPG